MRAFATLCLLAVVILGVATWARGDDDPADAGLRHRVETLELQVKYLTARETALTAYVLANEQRSAGLTEMARDARALGFAAAAVPAQSRERILAGFEAMARSLLADLPHVTK